LSAERPGGRQDEHDETTITKDPEIYFVDVVVFVHVVTAVGAFRRDQPT
jgi:hypothetical protein